MDETEDYEVAWAVESRAEELGWHRTKRRVGRRKIVLTLEKNLEPEPGEGGVDSS